MDLTRKTPNELDQLIANHVRIHATALPAYSAILEERARRSQEPGKLNVEKSLKKLAEAARRGVCVTYGDLAEASGVSWSKARHQMNGAHGHLDRLLDICQARGLPLLTAICVNQEGISSGELGADALAGFATGAKRLGIEVMDSLAFHHRCRDECWEWGRSQVAPP